MAGNIFNLLHKNSSIFLKLALFYAKKKNRLIGFFSDNSPFIYLELKLYFAL